MPLRRIEPPQHPTSRPLPRCRGQVVAAAPAKVLTTPVVSGPIIEDQAAA